jgi:16S rRNA (adenine1518-N6/adenine1519-N6)-dimethyltransferase
LINEAICEKIADAFFKENTEKNVLEIGPGKGALTKYLYDNKNINFKAVEADWDMEQYLLQNFNINGDQIIREDFLKLPLDKLFDKEPFSVIGNFPYNISSQILFRIDKYKDIVPFMVGMFQKEVAERIVSKEGSKVYGVTSVLLQASFEAKLLFHVSPGSFFPVPKVTSSVVMLKRKENYILPCNEKVFKAVVKASFNQRRKMLRNSIKALISDESLLNHRYMTLRPEQMSLNDYFELTTIIENQEL